MPFWRRKEPEPQLEPRQEDLAEIKSQIEALQDRMRTEYDNNDLWVESGILCKQRDLLEWRHSGVVGGYRIITAKDACPNCKRQSKRIYEINEPCPLPCPDCTNTNYGFCRCGIVPVLDIDMPKRRKS